MSIVGSGSADGTFTVRNSRGDVNTFTVPREGSDEYKLIANFLQPPLEIESVEGAKKYVQFFGKDNFTVMSYIPFEEDYEKIVKERVRSEFDEYNKSRLVDRNEIEEQFIRNAYRSPSGSDSYVIVRKPEVA